MFWGGSALSSAVQLEKGRTRRAARSGHQGLCKPLGIRSRTPTGWTTLLEGGGGGGGHAVRSAPNGQSRIFCFDQMRLPDVQSP